MTTGRDLRDAGVASVMAADTAITRLEKDDLVPIVERLAAAGKPFTADDVRNEFPQGWEPRHPNLMGAVFLSCARAGIIRRVGHRSSTVAARHSGTHAVWVGAEPTTN